MTCWVEIETLAGGVTHLGGNRSSLYILQAKSSERASWDHTRGTWTTPIVELIVHADAGRVRAEGGRENCLIARDTIRLLATTSKRK